MQFKKNQVRYNNFRSGIRCWALGIRCWALGIGHWVLGIRCLVLGVALIVFSCGKPLPTLENFDEQKWKEDKNACRNHRQEMFDAVRSQKDKLLALDEIEIVKLLGKPDRNELYKRNQKFYYYFIQPSADCGTAGSSASAQKLAIRFNAVGLAKEVNIE